MVDFLLGTVLAISGLVLLVTIFGAVYDAGNNGINDCSDDPKYCVTPQELERNWPQFKGLFDEANERRG